MSISPGKYEIGEKLVLPLFIFEGNHMELVSALKFHNSEEGLHTLMPLRNRYKQDHFNTDVSVLIINFVASARMLVDQCRRAVNKSAKTTQFVREFEAETLRLVTGNENIAIVHLLSDYCVHYFNPSLTTHHDFNRSFENKMARFTVPRDSLIRFAKRKLVKLKRDGLNTRSVELALAFLNQASKDLEIEEMIDVYHKITSAFYFSILEKARADE